MARIAEEPVRAAGDKPKAISADERARWLAFQRQWTLLEKRPLLNDARKEGRQAGMNQGSTPARREAALHLMRQTALGGIAIAAATGLTPAAVRAARRLRPNHKARQYPEPE